MHRTQFDQACLDLYHSCFDNLSRETYAKHIAGPTIVVARNRNLWLLLANKLKRVFA